MTDDGPNGNLDEGQHDDHNNERAQYEFFRREVSHRFEQRLGVLVDASMQGTVFASEVTELIATVRGYLDEAFHDFGLENRLDAELVRADPGDLDNPPGDLVSQQPANIGLSDQMSIEDWILAEHLSEALPDQETYS